MTAIIGAVVAAFGWIADKAVTIATILWHVIVIVGQALARFALAIGHIFVKVYKLLGSFWQNVLKPFVAWTWGRIDKLVGWLNRTFGPVLKFLELLRSRVLKIYDTYFKPIFDTIEVVRRVLQLLAALRIDFARELDAKLAALEDRLLWPIREAMLRINQVSDWVDRIVTLDGLLQRITLIQSTFRYAEDSWRALYNGTEPTVTAADRERIRSGGNALALEEAGRQARELVRTGQGPLSKYVEAGSNVARRQLRAA